MFLGQSRNITELTFFGQPRNKSLIFLGQPMNITDEHKMFFLKKLLGMYNIGLLRLNNVQRNCLII
jgi:hypothetical protein